MSASDLDAEISTKEKEISAAESNFKVRLESVPSRSLILASWMTTSRTVST